MKNKSKVGLLLIVLAVFSIFYYLNLKQTLMFKTSAPQMRSFSEIPKDPIINKIKELKMEEYLNTGELVQKKYLSNLLDANHKKYSSLEAAESNFIINVGNLEMSKFVDKSESGKNRFINSLNYVFKLANENITILFNYPGEAKIFDRLILGYLYTGMYYEKFSLNDSERFSKVISLINEGMTIRLISGGRYDDPELTKVILEHQVLRNKSYPCREAQALVQSLIGTSFLFLQKGDVLNNEIFDNASVDFANYYLFKCKDEIDSPFWAASPTNEMFSSKLWIASFVYEKFLKSKKRIPKFLYKELLSGYVKSGHFKEYKKVLRNMMFEKILAPENNERIDYILAYLKTFPLYFFSLLLSLICFYIGAYIRFKNNISENGEKRHPLIKKWWINLVFATRDSIHFLKEQFLGRSSDFATVLTYTFLLASFTLFLSETDNTFQLIMNSVQ